MRARGRPPRPPRRRAWMRVDMQAIHDCGTRPPASEASSASMAALMLSAPSSPSCSSSMLRRISPSSPFMRSTSCGKAHRQRGVQPWPAASAPEPATRRSGSRPAQRACRATTTKGVFSATRDSMSTRLSGAGRRPSRSDRSARRAASPQPAAGPAEGPPLPPSPPSSSTVENSVSVWLLSNDSCALPCMA